jgi:hypothetical protein
VGFELFVVNPSFIGSASADGMKTFYHRGHGVHGVEEMLNAVTNKRGCWDMEVAA